MKGIAISTIAYFVLALVTIMFMMTLLGNKIYPSLKSVYCNIFQGVRNILPIPTAMKPDVPMYCQRDQTSIFETVEILTKDPDRIADNIAAYTAACWETTGKVNLGQNKVCYELILRGVDGFVDQTMVENKLRSLMNPVFMDWQISGGIITGPKSIGISYDSTIQKIEVS